MSQTQMDWNAYYEAWNRHDGDAVASFFTDDAVYADQPLGQRHQGKDAIKGFVKSAESDASSDFRLTLLDQFATEERYALVWTFSGTHDRSSQDPALPLPATGKKFTVHGVSVGRLEGGKIKENTDYWNMVEFLTQVGMMPAPAGSGDRA